MSELLSGVRVVESAMLFNGDTLGAHLADLGADVIKVESPGHGDYIRHMLGRVGSGHSPAHLQVNRGKRSIVLDLRRPAHLDAFWRLIDTADVFVDGNAADALDRLGVGYRQQRSRKPEIVYCQYTGFGAEGPYAPIPTHGQMMDALAGAHPKALGADGRARSIPPAGSMGGAGTGGEGTAAGAIHAAFHVAAALVRRERTGEGAYIDVAGADAVLAQAWLAAVYELNDHRIVDRSSLPAVEGEEFTGARYQYYETADGRMVLFCAIEPKFWRNFCRLVRREDLLGAEGDGPVDFGVGQDAMRDELQTIFRGRSMAEWIELAASHDIPIGPAHRSITEAADDPHIAGRGTVCTRSFPGIGEFTYIGEVGRVAGQPFQVCRPAPEHGQHTREVLTELGYTDQEMADLAASPPRSAGRVRADPARSAGR